MGADDARDLARYLRYHLKDEYVKIIAEPTISGDWKITITGE